MAQPCLPMHMDYQTICKISQCKLLKVFHSKAQDLNILTMVPHNSNSSLNNTRIHSRFNSSMLRNNAELPCHQHFLSRRDHNLVPSHLLPNLNSNRFLSHHRPKRKSHSQRLNRCWNP